MNTPTHKTQKLAFVQYLRAIAVIAVVVDHAAGMAAFKVISEEYFTHLG